MAENTPANDLQDQPQQIAAPILTPAEALEMRVKAAQRAHDDEKEFGTGANAAAVKNAEEAISVAMLAFIGTLVSQGVLTSEQLARITTPLMYFGSGVAAAVIAAAASYFTNLGIAHRSNRRTREYEAPFIRDNASSRAGGHYGEVARWLGVIAVAASIGLFIGGLLSAKGAFSHLTPIVKTPAVPS
jgi:hypothetical protein